MLVLRLCPGGLLAMAPDCSSFTFPNSNRHKRKAGAESGDLHYGPVNLGNMMAVIALFLCQLALAHGVHFALENPPFSQMWRFFERLCPEFMEMAGPDGVKASGRQGLHRMTVNRCPYDDSPEPKLQKAYKWLATWPGIKGLNARCKCQQEHRKLGSTDSEGAWTGNPQLLEESAAYPKRLGQALLNMWMQGCVAINATWSNRALALTWVDPRNDVECRSAPQPDEVARASRSRGVKSSGFGPWGDVDDTQQSHNKKVQFTEASQSANGVVGSRSQGRAPSPDLGPWSSTSSSAGPSTSVAASGSSIGPWGALASASSATRSSALLRSRDHKKFAEPHLPAFGPWGNATSSCSEDGDAEAAPGQIGSPKE